MVLKIVHTKPLKTPKTKNFFPGVPFNKCQINGDSWLDLELALALETARCLRPLNLDELLGAKTEKSPCPLDDCLALNEAEAEDEDEELADILNADALALADALDLLEDQALALDEELDDTFYFSLVGSILRCCLGNLCWKLKFFNLYGHGKRRKLIKIKRG